MTDVSDRLRAVKEIYEKFMGGDFLYVGKASQRWDAVAKVTGKALFTADFLKYYKNLVYVYSVRTRYAHAVVRKLDASEAVKYPGVLKVLTARDIPGINDVGYVLPDQPLLADKKTRYIGDILALVVAEDYLAAVEAADKIYVEYEPLPVIHDSLQVVDLRTLKEKEHILVHNERGSDVVARYRICLLYTSPSPRDGLLSRMPSSA